ncbi:MAG: hypothetical protein LBI54_02745 [Lachnospiraceae bacterium]|nr:hypothetical protein [Lachnospiraceae bacterium]
MTETISFAEVPYLEELRNYLPIDATDKEDVSTYLKNVTDSILVNYGNEQYQFAYFGVHLLYMTYIYFSVRKISILIPERYQDAVVFAKPYHGRKLDFNNLESAFDYSLVAEKDLPNILKIIGLDDNQIGKIGGLVDNRNEMAHAKGRFMILNEEAFIASVNGIYNSVRNIHNRMDLQIRRWYKDFLLQYCNKKFEEYNDEFDDIIEEQMIQGFNLSIQELLVCNEMSIKPLTSEKPEFINELNRFKKALRKYCEAQGYIE